MPKYIIPPQEHQELALDRIAEALGLLVEYGTGTGKSRIMVDASQMFVQGGEVPGIIVTPNSLLEQTYDQFQEWAGKKWTERNVVWVGSWLEVYKRRELLKRGTAPIYLLSHESMSYKLIREAVSSRSWAFALVDEASRFRNYSQRTITLRALGTRSNSRYAFTGNLTVRNPADCWYITNFVMPGVWGTRDRKTFITKYFMLGGYSGVDPIGIRPDKQEEFFEILNSIRIQCELREVRDLPERTMTVRRTVMGKDQAAAYEQMRRTLRVQISRTNEADFMTKAKTYATRLLRLQEIAAGFGRNKEGDVIYFHNPKTTEMVESILDDPLTPTVIWYWFRPEAKIICAQLAKHGLSYAWLGAPGAVEAFMTGKVDRLVAQTGKGGFGLNLTRAEKMEYHTLPWDLDIYSQSNDRNVRLNTPDPKKGYLEIVHNILSGSCEEHVRNRLVDKASMSRKFSRSQALELLAP